MSSLAQVLAWKFDTAPGIRTRGKADGVMEIFDWPKALGAEPTPDQITAWTTEFEALPPIQEALNAEELFDMLVAKGVVGPPDRPRPR